MAMEHFLPVILMPTEPIKVMGANDDLSSLMFDVIFHSSNATYRGSFDSAIGYFNSDFNLNSKSKFDNPFDDTNLLYSQIFFYPNNNQLLINFASLVSSCQNKTVKSIMRILYIALF